MKAGVLYAREDIRYEDIPVPTPGKGEVLIKVKYSGICGSDLPRVNGDASHYYPIVLGHEFAGVVEEVGEGVTHVSVGDRVSGVPLIPCLKCENCQKGDYSLCKHYSFIGSRVFGSFAEYVIIPEKNAVKFDNNVSFEVGAFFEPITVALHGLNRLNYQGGKTVAIVGGGTIGLFTMQWAKIFGAKEVVVFDISDDRLKLAKKLGADEVINTSDSNFMEQVGTLTNGKGFDYVYETAGNIITIKMSFQLVANKGGVSLIGTPTKDMTFSVEEWENINRKEFTLTGSWMSYSAPFPGKEWELTAHYLKKGALKFDEELIYKIMPLSQIADAFKMFQIPGKVKAKILFDCENSN